MTGPYDDIIHLPRPISAKRRPMPAANRAAQFAPFAALTGYGAAITETGRLTDKKTELTEDAKAALDRKQALLTATDHTSPQVTVTWFRPDEKKEGGAYVTTTGTLKKVDEYERTLLLTNGLRIPLDDILELESPLFDAPVREDSSANFI